MSTEKTRAGKAPPWAWVSTTYIAEGLPFGLVRQLSSVYLTDIGVKNAYLGFVNFLGIPWNLKFLWAPAVDMFSTRRRWLLLVELIVTFGFAVVALLAFFGPETVQSAGDAGVAAATVVETATQSLAVKAIITLMVMLAFLSATHDIAIDSFYMEAISDPVEQAGYTGLRVLMYRLAIVFVKSALVAVAGAVSWTAGWTGGVVALALLWVFHLRYLPQPESVQPPGRAPGTVARGFVRAFITWLIQPRAVIILLFVLTYKLGDEVLFSMNTPFLKRELGITNGQYSLISGLIGTVFSIAGSLLSAQAIKLWGLRRAIWPLTLAMNLNIWAYIWLAWTVPDPTTVVGIMTIAGVHAYEQLAAGLGNAVLVVFIMRTCSAEFKAAHYAIASAVSSVGGTVFGGFGGIFVEHFGYLNLYLLAFAATLPGMVLLGFLRHGERGRAARSPFSS